MTPSPAPRPATSPTRSPPTPPPPGLDSYVFVPANLEEQKLLATGVYGTNLVGVRGNYDDVNRLCTAARRGVAPGPSSTSTCGPTTPRARRRSPIETVEQLGWELPDRVVCPIASGSLFTKAGPRLPGMARPRPGRAAASRPSTAPRRRAAARSPPPSPKAGRSASRSAPRRSPKASRSAIRPTGPTRSSRPARPAAPSTRSPTRRSARHQLLAETTGIFTETAGGVTVGVLRKLAERGEHRSGERVVVYITGEGLKTLDATRDTFPMHEIDPDLASFESEFAQEVASDGSHREDPDPAARRDRRPGRGRGVRGPPSARRSTRSSTPTATCASGSPRTATCAASSTSTSPARTSASSRAWRRRSTRATRSRSSRP